VRARNVKPSLFTNGKFAEADPLYGWTFIGLWCLADRAGRLKDDEAKIHYSINPGRVREATAQALQWLEQNGFIVRYQSNSQQFVQVVNFDKHQNPHCKEAPSTIPAPDPHGANIGVARLIPDSGSLIPDSGSQTASLRSSSPKTVKSSSSDKPPPDDLSKSAENRKALRTSLAAVPNRMPT